MIVVVAIAVVRPRKYRPETEGQTLSDDLIRKKRMYLPAVHQNTSEEAPMEAEPDPMPRPQRPVASDSIAAFGPSYWRSNRRAQAFHKTEAYRMAAEARSLEELPEERRSKADEVIHRADICYRPDSDMVVLKVLDRSLKNLSRWLFSYLSAH